MSQKDLIIEILSQQVKEHGKVPRGFIRQYCREHLMSYDYARKVWSQHNRGVTKGHISPRKVTIKGHNRGSQFSGKGHISSKKLENRVTFPVEGSQNEVKQTHKLSPPPQTQLDSEQKPDTENETQPSTPTSSEPEEAEWGSDGWFDELAVVAAREGDLPRAHDFHLWVLLEGVYGGVEGWREVDANGNVYRMRRFQGSGWSFTVQVFKGGGVKVTLGFPKPGADPELFKNAGRHVCEILSGVSGRHVLLSDLELRLMAWNFDVRGHIFRQDGIRSRVLYSSVLGAMYRLYGYEDEDGEPMVRAEVEGNPHTAAALLELWRGGMRAVERRQIDEFVFTQLKQINERLDALSPEAAESSSGGGEGNHDFSFSPKVKPEPSLDAAKPKVAESPSLGREAGRSIVGSAMMHPGVTTSSGVGAVETSRRRVLPGGSRIEENGLGKSRQQGVAGGEGSTPSIRLPVKSCSGCQGFLADRGYCRYMGKETRPEWGGDCLNFLGLRGSGSPSSGGKQVGTVVGKPVGRAVGKQVGVPGWSCLFGLGEAVPGCLARSCKYIPGTHSLCPLLKRVRGFR